MEAAADFCQRWGLAEGEDFPEPTMDDPPPEVFVRVGADDEHAVRAVQSWWALPLWERAAVAMLSDKRIRVALPGRSELIASARRVVELSGAGQCLLWGLQMLDDEKLVVLHRPSGQGFEFRMGGIADNFQLHTLLAAELVTPGLVPGVRPSPEAVAACYGRTPDAPIQYDATGAFNLVAPDGSWIWNEGTPSDIPVVGSARLLVLDPPPYERTWTSGRLLPRVSADFKLIRQLTIDEVADWKKHVADPRMPFQATQSAAPTKSPRRAWWRRGST
jgi:hypothetical protein